MRMMTQTKISIMLFLLTGFAFSNPISGFAAEPAAMVEDYEGGVSKFEFMQLLAPGEQFSLSPDEKLVLGYFASCIREIITGGTITIGAEESKVTGGNLDTEDVDCDGGVMIGPLKSRKEAAAAVFRKGTSQKSLPKPDWTLFGLSPIFKLSKPADHIVISRLDEEGKLHELTPEGLVFDTSKIGLTLESSGLYKVTVNEDSFILKISPLAEEDAPILSRILVFDTSVAE